MGVVAEGGGPKTIRRVCIIIVHLIIRFYVVGTGRLADHIVLRKESAIWAVGALGCTLSVLGARFVLFFIGVFGAVVWVDAFSIIRFFITTICFTSEMR